MDFQKELPVYSPQVIEFVAVANEFCNYLEQLEGFSRPDFIDKSLKILALLYYKSSLVPSTESVLDEPSEQFVTEEDWNNIFSGVKSKLGKYNDYQEVIDPLFKDTEDEVGGSIAENFADLYQELKDFISIYRLGTPEMMNDALWDCRQRFNVWGQKLLNSLRALHNVSYGENTIEEDDPDYEAGSKKDEDKDNWIFSQRRRIWDEDGK